MNLDELFSNLTLEDAFKSAKGVNASLAKQLQQKQKQIDESIDDAKQQMKFWVKSHLTQLKNKNIDRVPLVSIAKELNDVSTEFGFPHVDPNEPDMIIDLIQGDSKLQFIDKIEDGIVFLKQKSGDHERDVSKTVKRRETAHIDQMAKSTIDKKTKGK